MLSFLGEDDLVLILRIVVIGYSGMGLVVKFFVFLRIFEDF